MAFADLTNVFVFPRIFATHPDILRGLLNDLLERQVDDLIESIEYLPSEQLPLVGGEAVDLGLNHPPPRATRPQAHPIPLRPRAARRISLPPLFAPPRNPTPNAPTPLARPRNPPGRLPRRLRTRAQIQNQRFDPLSAPAQPAWKRLHTPSAPAQLPKYHSRAHSALDEPQTAG